MANGRMRKPPRSAYIAERNRTGRRSNISRARWHPPRFRARPIALSHNRPTSFGAVDEPSANRCFENIDSVDRAVIDSRTFGVRSHSEISLWLEKLSELLEKLAVAREVAGGIFPLHLAEQCACTLEHFVTRSLIGRAGRRTSALAHRRGGVRLRLTCSPTRSCGHRAGAAPIPRGQASGSWSAPPRCRPARSLMSWLSTSGNTMRLPRMTCEPC